MWAGGAFTSIGGLNRNRVAALDASTGQGVAGFNASASSTVFALEQAGGVLYLGGWFAQVDGANRSSWPRSRAPPAPGDGVQRLGHETVRGLEVVPGTNTLAVGGNFTQSAASRGASSGALAHDRRGHRLDPAGECDTCTVLDVAARGDLVYAAVAGPGGRASAWSATTGVRRWSQFGDGDVQVVSVVGDTVYAGGHFDPQFGASGGVSTTRHEIAAIDAASGLLLPWQPAVTGPDGIWAIAGTTDSLWIGGGYTRVNGDTRAGRLTMFPVARSAPVGQVVIASDATGATTTAAPTGAPPGADDVRRQRLDGRTRAGRLRGR